jgi:hypothetical protein
VKVRFKVKLIEILILSVILFCIAQLVRIVYNRAIDIGKEYHQYDYHSEFEK